MSVTAIDAVVSAVLTRLRAQPQIAGDRVYEEGDIDEIPESVETALVVGMESAQPQEIVLSAAPLRWTTVVRVECFARRSARRGGVLPATQLHAAVHERLMSDPTLGGVASGVELVRLAVDRELAATRTAVLVAFYAIDHRSTHDTLLPA